MASDASSLSSASSTPSSALDPAPDSAPGPAPDPAPGPAPNPAPGPAPNPAPGPAPNPAPGPAPDPAPGPAPDPALDPAMILGLGPLPDFDRLEQLARNTADEFAKFRNLPAFAQGRAILEAINQLGTQINAQGTQINAQGTQINARIDGINARIDGINTRIDGIDTRLNGIDTRLDNLDNTMTHGFADIQTRLQATNHNAVARVANSRVSRLNMPFAALHNATTNAAIPGFPGNTAQLNALPGPVINNVLTGLNLPTNGTVLQRRQRLRLAIGLLEEAV